jgi:hypothetical protein
LKIADMETGDNVDKFTAVSIFTGGDGSSDSVLMNLYFFIDSTIIKVHFETSCTLF